MRRFRPLLLLAIVAILGAVGWVYRSQRDTQQRRAPAIPRALPAEKSAALDQFCWNQTQNGRTTVQVCAASFEQIKSPSRGYLTGVEVQIFDANGLTFDRFKTQTAEYNIEDGVLYASGDVEITTGEPVGDAPPGRRVRIQTSGLKFESKAGRASTDKPTRFQFEYGEGTSIGASYDPEFRELVLKSQAKVTWFGKDPKAKPFLVETDELIYKERDAAILAGPFSKLRRGTMTVEGGRAVAWLKEGNVERVEASQARGQDRPEEGRDVEYAAQQIFVDFGAGGEVRQIAADKDARLRSSSKAGVTVVTADHVDLRFDLAKGASQLASASARGRGVVESLPAVGVPGLKRVLRSEEIDLKMRPGGEEIERVETRARGVIEFHPAAKGQALRRMEAARIVAVYGPANRVRNLAATDAATRSEPPATEGKPAPPPLLTWSRQLSADFDAARGEMVRLEQWGDFRYEEGDRRGRAERAVLDTRDDRITLSRAARFWDASGSISAGTIVMNQRSGDVQAEGNVASAHEPDTRKQTASMLSPAETFQATAGRMFLEGASRRIRYEGNAVVWQGGNRIEADRIEIDRAGQELAARGNVRTRLVGTPGVADAKAAPMVTSVRAPEMDYAEKTHTAVYRGGVTLTRGPTQVTSTELRGIFASAPGASALEKAIADGNVVILQSSGGRVRKGVAEHAEYALTEEKVTLSGGTPEFTDSWRGSTRGTQLTWFSGNGRLLVNGRDDQPAVSVIRRK